MNKICKTEPANLNQSINQYQNDNVYNNEYIRKMLLKDSYHFEQKPYPKLSKEFDQICDQSRLKILATDKQDLQYQIKSKIQYMKNQYIQEQHKKNLNSKVYSILYGTLSQFDTKKSPTITSRKVSNPTEQLANNHTNENKPQKLQTNSTKQTLNKKQSSEKQQLSQYQNRNQMLIQQLLEKQIRQKRSVSQNDNDCNQSFEYNQNNKSSNQLSQKQELNLNIYNNFKDINSSIVFNEKQPPLNFGENNNSFILDGNTNLNQSVNQPQDDNNGNKLIKNYLNQNDESFQEEDQSKRNCNNKKQQLKKASYHAQMNPNKNQKNTQSMNKQKNLESDADNQSFNKQLSKILQNNGEILNEKKPSYIISQEQANISMDNSKSNRNLRNSFSSNEINSKSPIQAEIVNYNISQNNSTKNGSAFNKDNQSGDYTNKIINQNKNKQTKINHKENNEGKKIQSNNYQTEQLINEYIEGKLPPQFSKQQSKEISEEKSQSRQNELPKLQQFELQHQYKQILIKFDRKLKGPKLYSKNQGYNSLTPERINKQNQGNNFDSNILSPLDTSPLVSDQQKIIFPYCLYPVQVNGQKFVRNYEELNNSNINLLNGNDDKQQVQKYRLSEALPQIGSQSPKQRAPSIKKISKSFKRDGSKSPHIELTSFQQELPLNIQQSKEINTKSNKEKSKITTSYALEKSDSQSSIDSQEIYNFDGIKKTKQKYEQKVIQTESYNKYFSNNIERAKAKSDHIQTKNIQNQYKIDHSQHLHNSNLTKLDRSQVKISQTPPPEQNPTMGKSNITLQRLDSFQERSGNNQTILKFQKAKSQQNQYKEDKSKEILSNYNKQKENFIKNEKYDKSQGFQVQNQNVNELKKENELKQQMKNYTKINFKDSEQNISNNRIRASSSSQRLLNKQLDQTLLNIKEDQNNVSIVKQNLKEKLKLNKNKNINEEQSIANTSKHKIQDNNIQQLPKQNENVLQQLQNNQPQQQQQYNIKSINIQQNGVKMNELLIKKNEQSKNISMDNTVQQSIPNKSQNKNQHNLSKKPSIETQSKEDQSQQLESYFRYKYSSQSKSITPEKQFIKIRANQSKRKRNKKQDFNQDFSNLDPWEIDLNQDNYLF